MYKTHFCDPPHVPRRDLNSSIVDHVNFNYTFPIFHFTSPIITNPTFRNWN